MDIIKHFLFGEILKEVKLLQLIHLPQNYRGILTSFAFNTLHVFNSNNNNTVAVKYRKYSLYDFLQGTYIQRFQSVRDLYVLSFSMRKDNLYESVKKFVKTRKEDLIAYFKAYLQIRKFIISCCDNWLQKLVHLTESRAFCRVWRLSRVALLIFYWL